MYLNFTITSRRSLVEAYNFFYRSLFLPSQVNPGSRSDAIYIIDIDDESSLLSRKSDNNTSVTFYLQDAIFDGQKLLSNIVYIYIYIYIWINKIIIIDL